MSRSTFSWDQFSEVVGASLTSSVIKRDVGLGEKTTYRSGGKCRAFIRIETVADLRIIAQKLKDFPYPVAVIGNGSNLLISDSGFDGLVLRLGDEFSSIMISGETVVVGGSANLPVVARKSVAAGLTGFEWAVGVPGTMGGAIRMNAGGHGSDMSKSVERVEGVNLKTGEWFSLSLEELDFSYRESSITADHVISEVVIRLDKGQKEESEKELSEIVRWRIENQPGGQNAGSVFTNPINDSAGRLIEAAGCKGIRIGSASVSEKHANFIQVDQGGSSEDVRQLMEKVKSCVYEEFGIELIPENHFLGFG
ncbi:MAG: UDP-N-acetylenolpyruvoylglucosamine reductase [Acidimicrobiaceae bacterium]|nr:UDP-N-acetylenolpyruvoylglucosamine reductase [Acidimicrobiaceae bacterium]|tara:strand:+ start:4034 stop:4960 length:927 start_codon:yes stop_codon:yes gene_type:complete